MLTVTGSSFITAEIVELKGACPIIHQRRASTRGTIPFWFDPHIAYPFVCDMGQHAGDDSPDRDRHSDAKRLWSLSYDWHKMSDPANSL